MKRGIIIFITLAILPLVQVKGQNQNIDKLNAYKIAFFTKKLNLTSPEAEKFWPVYNDFQFKRNLIQQERSILNRKVNQIELNMTEKEMIEAGDKLISLEVQEANLALEFHKKFKEILTPAKVIRLYQAENQFKIDLLNELKNNNPGVRTNPIKRGPGIKP